MYKINWELIPEEKLKEWVEALRFDVKKLEEECRKKTEISKKKCFATEILDTFYLGICADDDELKEMNDTEEYTKWFINLTELEKEHGDLFKFWGVAQPYWAYKDKLSEVALEPFIKALNSYLVKQYGI